MLAGGPATPKTSPRSLPRFWCRWPRRLESRSRTCAGRCRTWPRKRRPSPTRSPAGSTVLRVCGPCATGSVPVRVEDACEARCEASLTADLSNQRGEYLSLAGILAATLAVLFILAGMQSPLFFLGVLPVVAAPVFGFRYAYSRGCREIRRSLDDLLDAVEVARPEPEDPQDRQDRPQGPIQGLEPIPRFTPQKKEDP